MQFRRRRTIPELNATSTADISFMLLIFFLITSSLSVDRGMTRELPPPDTNKVELNDVPRERCLNIYIDAENKLFVNERNVDENQLKKQVVDIVLKWGNKHYLMLATEPKTAYEHYFKLQNDIAQAYEEAKERCAHDRFGKTFAQCSLSQRNAVENFCKQRVAESYE